VQFVNSLKNWESYCGLCASVGETHNVESWLLFRRDLDVLRLCKLKNYYMIFKFSRWGCNEPIYRSSSFRLKTVKTVRFLFLPHEVQQPQYGSPVGNFAKLLRITVQRFEAWLLPKPYSPLASCPRVLVQFAATHLEADLFSSNVRKRYQMRHLYCIVNQNIKENIRAFPSFSSVLTVLLLTLNTCIPSTYPLFTSSLGMCSDRCCIIKINKFFISYFYLTAFNTGCLKHLLYIIRFISLLHYL
jgi:hypothetical protein